MSRNPFKGRGTRAKFARAVYRRLLSREWFTIADVMADYQKLKSPMELDSSISKCDGYGELKKAIADILGLLQEKTDGKCVEIEGNNRCRRFKYIGVEEDPLEDLCNASAIKDVSIYAQFCIDSAGFFPKEWVEYFLEDTLNLLKITRRRKSGAQFIMSSSDRHLENIHLLPLLYEYIRDRRVLAIEYAPYGKDSTNYLFHPHLLKEYNGRWFLFGHADGHNPEFGFNIALDRIKDVNEASREIAYIPAPAKFYDELFKNLVGVSHNEGARPVEVIVRAHTPKVFHLTETKKLHRSQKTLKPFGDYADGRYGEFKLFVELNNEFIGRILQMAEGLEIVSPPGIRSIFKERISKMARLYDRDEC